MHVRSKKLRKERWPTVIMILTFNAKKGVANGVNDAKKDHHDVLRLLIMMRIKKIGGPKQCD